MDLSIIILNYKQKGLVKQCIKGIERSQIRLNYEVIVVDNNSGDHCLELINKEFPYVITIQSGANLGFAAGNNIGLNKANGKYVLILNPDIAITDNVIEVMHDFMEKNIKAGIAGPKLINPDGTIQYSCRRYPSWKMPICRRTIIGKLPFCRQELDDYLMKDWSHAENKTVDWLFGACLFIRKSCLDKVGSFDERFFMYFEDLDLCRRFWEKGFEVCYLADVQIVHYHQRLSAEKEGLASIFKKITRIHLTSGVKYFKKYFGKKPPIHKN